MAGAPRAASRRQDADGECTSSRATFPPSRNVGFTLQGRSAVSFPAMTDNRAASRLPAAAFPALSVIFALLSLAPMAALAHGPDRDEILGLTRRIESGRDEFQNLLVRGDLHRRNREWAEALADYDRAAALAPGRKEIDLSRAALELDRGRAPDALAAVDRFLAQSPEHSEAHRLRGRALVALDRRSEAAAAFARAIASTARPTPEVYLERALALDGSSPTQKRDALAALDQGIERLGEVIPLDDLAIDLEIALGRTDAALARLDRLGPQYALRAPVLERRAAILDAAGRGDEARMARAAARAAREPATAANPLGLATLAVERTAPAAAPAASNPGRTINATTFVPRNSVWSYRADSTAPDTSWRSNAYDDSLWPAGPGILGYGEVYIATPVPFGPDPFNRYITTYFRLHFDLPEGVDSSQVRDLTMAMNYDDGFLAYLNGHLILQRSIPAGPVSHSTLALSHEGGVYETVVMPMAASRLRTTGNVLAIELHQAGPASNDLVWDAELSGLTTEVLVTRGPYLQNAAPTAMTLRWRTDVPSDSRVQYGPSPGSLTFSADDPALTTEHEVRITGLAPGSRTYYSIGTSVLVLAGGDSSHTFATVPAAPEATRMWVIGDSGIAGPNALAVRDAYLNYSSGNRADFMLMLGDNAYTVGTDGEYQASVFNQYPAILRNTPLWATRGNHDLVYSGINNDYYDIFTLPTAAEAGGLASGSEAYYSFDYSNMHIVCLDSEGSDLSPGSTMMTWLQNDVNATNQDWVIAFFHHPPYTKGSHDSDNEGDSFGKMTKMRKNALPILEGRGVDLVLTGHSHSYERSCLLDAHYDSSTTLVPSMKIDPGDGRANGDGVYVKEPLGPAPHLGAVYAVAGSSSQIGGGLLNHPAMITSQNVLGSMIIDVDAGRLEARFLDNFGVVRDSFAIAKGGVAAVTPGAPTRSGLWLAVAGPNPFTNGTRFAGTMPVAGKMRIELLDASGRRVKTLARGSREAGRFEVEWDGADAAGRRVAAGMYFAVIEQDGKTAACRVVRLP